MKGKLLGVNNAKTIKGEDLGVLTGILYLAPHKIAGPSVCKWSTRGCRESCLYSAGRAGFLPNINEARIRKTRLYHSDRGLVMDTLRSDLDRLTAHAMVRNLTPAVRLNGTSDIPWETTGIFGEYPEVQFYDYTKAPRDSRPEAHNIANYSLTYSLTESKGSWARALEWLWTGAGVSMVVDPESKALLLDRGEYKGFPVLDGDLHDVRFLDPAAHIVLLKAKGQAKSDTRGFTHRLQVLN